MTRRRFRQLPDGSFTELVDDPTAVVAPAVHGDTLLTPITHGGNTFTSKHAFEQYKAQRDLVPYDPDYKGEQPSVAEKERERREFREMLWEGLSRTYSIGNKPRDGRR